MDYKELLVNAKENIGPYCKACTVCDGKACRNQIPGPGAKGFGDTAIRNAAAWKEYRVLIDTIHDNYDVSTEATLFGHTFKAPIFAGPVGAVKSHYSSKYTDQEYNDILVRSCANENILAFTGDGLDLNIMDAATKAIKKANGMGVPTIKPWNVDDFLKRVKLANESNSIAVAMDIDAAGLPFLRNMTPKAGAKGVEELKQIISLSKKPFIIKGIMTLEGARKAYEAGASGIVVSNHGGRVMEDSPATAEVLEEIAKAYKGKMTILVDGGIRSGADVFKALALGADGVIIARPYVVALYGGEDEGIKILTNKLIQELSDTMMMCNAQTIKDIKREMLFKK